MRRMLMWAAVGAAALVGGCAANIDPGTTPETRRMTAAADSARTVVIRRGSDGAPVAWDELVAAAGGADAVLVGELHGQPVGQAFEGALFEDVLARSPSTVGALEFFERDEQAGLDDYLTGVTDEQGMTKATRRSEGNYPGGHRAIVERSKGAGRPVIAANAPREYVRLARLEGYGRLNALTAEQRRLFVVPGELPGGKYREDFFAFMRGGSKEPGDAPSESKIEAMLRSQSVWDATMADSVARGIDAGGKPVVLVVGGFHVGFDGGLVQALRREKPGARVVTVAMVGEWAPASGVGDGDRGRADYVVYVGPGG
jgi:uncharacterized iron-regulated protein